tara:strand:- start:200 stop:337 length:138 start_codon:yes stop_codon:yes gene_type:complete
MIRFIDTIKIIDSNHQLLNNDIKKIFKEFEKGNLFLIKYLDFNES